MKNSPSIDARITRAFREQNGFDLEPHLLVLGLMGSHSHGTYLPPTEPDGVDDVDLMGFVVPPIEYHLGLPRWSHWGIQIDELDVVLYSLEKAVRLLLKSNPNIVGLLWLDADSYLYTTPLFDRLRAQRTIFSSQEAAKSFTGYAVSQLQKMEAFDLSRMDEYESLTSMIQVHGSTDEVLNAEPERLLALSRAWACDHSDLLRFRKLHRASFSGHLGAKRKSLVRKYSYDVKNAAHLIRLLRMGIEFLDTGQLHVRRTVDADELKTIKTGGWPLDRVKDEAARLSILMETARIRSVLPPCPDAAAANRLLLEIQGEALGIGPLQPSDLTV